MRLGREQEQDTDERHPGHGDDADGQVPLAERERPGHKLVSPRGDAQEDGRSHSRGTVIRSAEPALGRVSTPPLLALRAIAVPI